MNSLVNLAAGLLVGLPADKVGLSTTFVVCGAVFSTVAFVAFGRLRKSKTLQAR